MPSIGDLRPGDPANLGGFAIRGRLGEGGQGVVYLGADQGGGQVAIKWLRPHLAGDAVAAERFAREAAAAQRVAPFCTAKVVATGVHEERPYIVSEYVDGQSLQQVVAHEGARSEAAMYRLAIGTVTALAAIHQAGIVHRDFSPNNVLLAPEGPRVIDFGIAKALGVTSTLTSAPVGTPAFMAPEQIMGKQAGPPVDLFAWASTMVFAASGVGPFAAESVPAIIHRVLYTEPDLSALSGTLRDVVTACLSKDPARRPTAEQVILSLLQHPGSNPPDLGRAAAIATGRHPLPPASRAPAPGSGEHAAAEPPDARWRAPRPGSEAAAGWPGPGPEAAAGRPGPGPEAAAAWPGPDPEAAAGRPGPGPEAAAGRPGSGREAAAGWRGPRPGSEAAAGWQAPGPEAAAPGPEAAAGWQAAAANADGAAPPGAPGSPEGAPAAGWEAAPGGGHPAGARDPQGPPGGGRPGGAGSAEAASGGGWPGGAGSAEAASGGGWPGGAGSPQQAPGGGVRGEQGQTYPVHRSQHQPPPPWAAPGGGYGTPPRAAYQALPQVPKSRRGYVAAAVAASLAIVATLVVAGVAVVRNLPGQPVAAGSTAPAGTPAASATPSGSQSPGSSASPSASPVPTGSLTKVTIPDLKGATFYEHPSDAVKLTTYSIWDAKRKAWIYYARESLTGNFRKYPDHWESMLSPNGRYLAQRGKNFTGDGYDSIEITDKASGESFSVKTSREPLSAYIQVWSRDSTKVLVNVGNPTKTGWQSTGFAIVDVQSRQAEVSSLRESALRDIRYGFDATGAQVVALAWEGRQQALRFFSPSGDRLRRVPNVGAGIADFLFSPSGKQFLTNCPGLGRGTHCLYDTATGQEARRFESSCSGGTTWYDDSHLACWARPDESENRQQIQVIDFTGTMVRVLADVPSNGENVEVYLTYTHAD